MEIKMKDFIVPFSKDLDLKKYETKAPKEFHNKEKNKKMLSDIVKEIDYYQNILYAEGKQSLLIVFQGIDAAGKDSSIRAIMTGVNPQGVEVTSFKTPTSQEYKYNYLWRHQNKIPQKGKIGIFNRSHYENVLISRVHPQFILNENIPSINSLNDINEKFFNQRYDEINKFEKFLENNGTQVLKFFLNISKDEQKKRFIKRIENKEKNWKFSSSDLKEREFWNQYQKAFTLALQNTSTDYSPWFIIPCDYKSYGQLIMGYLIKETLKKMHPKFPNIDNQEKKELDISYKNLLKE